jgi:nucleoside-diphosphate-sugar epimerase
VKVFITGGTGYIGSRLIPELVRYGHAVRALVRTGSEDKLPPGADGFVGEALRADSFSGAIPPSDTFVHLIGVPHPSPTKATQFRAIDLVSIEAAVTAASKAGIAHFVYLSVARPAPVMQVFQEVRQRGEELILQSGINATFVRPWYVLGPGHRWPIPLMPFYWLAEKIPKFRDAARRLAFVTIDQMINSLIWTVENPPVGTRIMRVPDIHAGRGDNEETSLSRP